MSFLDFNFDFEVDSPCSHQDGTEEFGSDSEGSQNIIQAIQDRAYSLRKRSPNAHALRQWACAHSMRMRSLNANALT